MDKRSKYGPEVGIDLPGARRRVGDTFKPDMASILLAIAIVLGLVLAIALLSGVDTGLLGALVKWTPFLAKGFLLNVVMSLIAIVFGTIGGVFRDRLHHTCHRELLRDCARRHAVHSIRAMGGRPLARLQQGTGAVHDLGPVLPQHLDRRHRDVLQHRLVRKAANQIYFTDGGLIVETCTSGPVFLRSSG